MSDKSTIFYRGNTAVSVDFSAEEIILLNSIDYCVTLVTIFQIRHPLFYIFTHVFMLMQGYEDANDVFHLQHDPLCRNILEGDLASQPTISR